MTLEYSPFSVHSMPELTEEEALRLDWALQLRCEKDSNRSRRLRWKIAKSYLRDGKRESAAIELGCHERIGL